MNLFNSTDSHGILSLFQDTFPTYSGSFLEVINQWPNCCWFALKNNAFYSFHQDTLDLLNCSAEHLVDKAFSDCFSNLIMSVDPIGEYLDSARKGHPQIFYANFEFEKQGKDIVCYEVFLFKYDMFEGDEFLVGGVRHKGDLCETHFSSFPDFEQQIKNTLDVGWVDALQDSIENHTPFNKAKDPRQCTFGKWYDTFESENDDLTHILKKFDEPHVAIHSLADKLLTLAEKEGKEKALQQLLIHRQTTLNSLRNLFSAAREAVSSSYKPVIVYTTLNGSTPCLGFLVESVDDALTIDESDIKSFSNDGAIQFMGDLNLPEMISGLITKDDVNSLLIDPNLVKAETPEIA